MGRVPAPLRKRTLSHWGGADAFDVVEQHEGSDTAQVYITRQLQRHPTMRVFHKLMDYHLNDAKKGVLKRA